MQQTSRGCIGWEPMNEARSRVATRGGVNGPAPPVQRGRERPLLIVQEVGFEPTTTPWATVTIQDRPGTGQKTRGWRKALYPLSYPCSNTTLLSVWVTGIAPATSRSRTPRSATELRPENSPPGCGRWRHAASESNTASPGLESRPFPRRRRKTAADEATALRVFLKDNAAHPARLVPPRGFEPLPTTFAVSCPVLGTVAGEQGRSRWNRTITCAGMGRDGALHGLRARAPAPCGIRGGNRTRVAGSRNRSTGCCTTRTSSPAPPACELAGSTQRVRDGDRTRVTRWKDGGTGPLYDTDETSQRKTPRTRIGIELAALARTSSDRRSYPPEGEQWARNGLWPKPVRDSLLLRSLGRPSVATLGPL